MSERLSHSYCRDCDVMFQAADDCPRCGGTNLVHPPPGSPRPPRRIMNRGGSDRKWIERNPVAEYPAW